MLTEDDRHWGCWHGLQPHAHHHPPFIQGQATGEGDSDDFHCLLCHSKYRRYRSLTNSWLIDRQYMLFFGASLNAIPWCYATEIMPLKARAKGTSVAVMTNWTFVSLPFLPCLGIEVTWLS